MVQGLVKLLQSGLVVVYQPLAREVQRGRADQNTAGVCGKGAGNSNQCIGVTNEGVEQMFTPLGGDAITRPFFGVQFAYGEDAFLLPARHQ